MPAKHSSIRRAVQKIIKKYPNFGIGSYNPNEVKEQLGTKIFHIGRHYLYRQGNTPIAVREFERSLRASIEFSLADTMKTENVKRKTIMYDDDTGSFILTGHIPIISIVFERPASKISEFGISPWPAKDYSVSTASKSDGARPFPSKQDLVKKAVDHKHLFVTKAEISEINREWRTYARKMGDKMRNEKMAATYFLREKLIDLCFKKVLIELRERKRE